MKRNEYVLILGAKSSSGKAIVHIYAKHGYNLYLAGRGKEDLQDDVNDLEIRYNINARAVEFDILDYENHSEFYSGLNPEPFGVILTIGYLGDQDKANDDRNEARKIIEINYLGCINILDIVASYMEKKRQGFIVGLSSVAGDRGRKKNFHYGSAKAGLTAYLSGLRNRLHSSGVNVLTVIPGYIFSKMTEGMELPALLTSSPESVARYVYSAQQRGKNIIYIKWIWRWLMLVIKSIPESIFKKLNI